MIGNTLVYVVLIVVAGILIAQGIAALSGRGLHITRSGFTFLPKD